MPNQKNIRHAIVLLVWYQTLNTMLPPEEGTATGETTTTTAPTIGPTKLNSDGSLQFSPTAFASPRLITTPTGAYNSVKQTTGNKHNTGFGAKYISKTNGSSLVQRSVQHPGAGALGVTGSLDTFLNSLSQNPQFLPHFTKLKVVILQDIYDHLLKVYTNFNMQHPTNTLDYLTQEETYGMNKKTLVINHLVNIIEAQTNGLMTQLFPSLDKSHASFTGNFLMQHDSSSLEDFLIDVETNLYLQASDKQLITTKNNTFFSILGSYFTFFNEYTSLLDTSDPSTGLNSLVIAAQKVAQVISSYSTPLSNSLSSAGSSSTTKTISLKDGASKAFSLNTKTALVRAAKDNNSYLNPGLFFYDNDTFRGMKLIPDLAKKIETGGYQKAGWPSQVISYAKSGTPAVYETGAFAGISQGVQQGYPIAYFKDTSGNQTTSESSAAGLFVNMPNGTSSVTSYTGTQGQRSTLTSLHEQELLKEPDWLNTQDGILKLLKACLGDFSKIVGMGILNPCNEAIIIKSTNLSSASTNWQECENYLNTIISARQKYYQNNPPQPPETSGA